MARPPSKPRAARAPRAAPERRRSATGRVAAILIGLASAGAVGAGLELAGPPATSGPSCGGTERWSIKVATDVAAGAINPEPTARTVTELNAILPGPVGLGGRMQVEKAEITTRGFLSFFKHEEDGDFHLVITEKPGDFATGKQPPNGRSLVVEMPDLDCLRGKSGKGPSVSPLFQAMAEARAEFEDKMAHISGTHITTAIPVTVTGVTFFDFDHGQTGRAIPHPGADGQRKVIELHPVTAISFTDAVEPD